MCSEYETENRLLLDSALVKQLALQVGFHACGIARAQKASDFGERLSRWLADGRQADMHYMERNASMRVDPTELVPGAKSVISLLLGYKPSRRMQGDRLIAYYAYGEDYHAVIKGMLFKLIALIKDNCPDFEAKPCVDTVPISDKYWAYMAGLGWRGRNTLLINPKLGSFCNIAELVTTSEADHYDSPMVDGCAGCTKCWQACPNNALGDGGLDARRCTAYHTIESHASELPKNLKRNGYIFGCDCCQVVCPYNIRSQEVRDMDDEQMRRLQSLPDIAESDFKKATKGSPLSRIDYNQWRRNQS